MSFLIHSDIIDMSILLLYYRIIICTNASKLDFVRKDKDLIINQEIGNGVYRSITSLLHLLIPILNEKFILKENDTIYLKLGADGRNVGRYHNHVIYTVCIRRCFIS